MRVRFGRCIGGSLGGGYASLLAFDWVFGSAGFFEVKILGLSIEAYWGGWYDLPFEFWNNPAEDIYEEEG